MSSEDAEDADIAPGQNPAWSVVVLPLEYPGAGCPAVPERRKQPSCDEAPPALMT
jgi:hypothetical protein